MTHHTGTRTNTRTLRTVFAAAVTLIALTTATTPAQAAAAAPNATPDNANLTAGKTVNVNVLANDSVSGGNSRATVRVIKTPTALKATVLSDKRLNIKTSASTKPGIYRATYRVTDRYGKSDTAVVSVKVTAPPAPDPTLLRTRLAALPVATETRTGYDRDLYKHWIDADKNGCDTRREVLIAEATSKPTVLSGCKFDGGTWFSYYDGISTTDPTGYDIDHMIPLAESFDSGAAKWDADTRMRFANDLDDPRALVAVTASSNRSKGDQDPAEWMPPSNSDNVACRYLLEWVAVKVRWSLSVDTAEKSAISTELTQHSCPNVAVPVTKATVTLAP